MSPVSTQSEKTHSITFPIQDSTTVYSSFISFIYGNINIFRIQFEWNGWIGLDIFIFTNKFMIRFEYYALNATGWIKREHGNRFVILFPIFFFADADISRSLVLTSNRIDFPFPFHLIVNIVNFHFWTKLTTLF